MSVRGQTPEAWLARWRRGDCPVHGGGMVDEEAAPNAVDEHGGAAEGRAARCARAECSLRACRWPGKDASHSFFGWLAGPEEIRAALAGAGDIEDGGPRPGHHARSVRTAWPLPDD